MAAVAPSSNKTADLMQNLTLDSESKAVGVTEPAKKSGNGAAKGSAKPFNPNSCFVPNGYQSAYYYGGYDGQGDWNAYSRYLNLDGGLAQNIYGSRYPSGLEMFSGLMNGMYPSNRMYSQYGNTFRPNSRFGSAMYGTRMDSVDSKLNATGYGCSPNHFRKNIDGFNELNKGPRATKSSDNKIINSLGPVTLLLKGQNLPVKSDNKEVPPAPSKEQFNGKDFSENYSDAKFFVIKSYSEDDIHKSIKYSVWASTPNGNKKLDAAYQEAKEKPSGCPIFLLFSVNTSGQFVGLAEMLGPVDFGKTVDYWQQDRWTGCFSVRWHIIKDIPNSLLRHITLENNEDKPVTNSRDTQEVKFEKGVQLVKIFKEHSSQTCILDDFGFYETREKATQEKKSKEQQVAKPDSKPIDLTIGKVTLLKSLDE